MAAYFKSEKSEGDWQEWHVGEPLPRAAEGVVVTIQADGDELQAILQGLLAT